MTAVPHVKTHLIRQVPEDFDRINLGIKTFLAAHLDEGFKVGDYVLFKEFSGGVYTQRTTLKEITYIQILSDDAVCILALNRPY